MNELKFKKLSDIDVKAEGGDFIIKGYGSVFNVLDSDRDIVLPGAFAKTLMEMKDRVALCYQHNIYEPIGKFQELREDQKGLYFEARISDAEPTIKTKIKEGILKEFSIGYRTIIRERVENTDGQPSIDYLKELQLYEISLVTLACNKYATLEGMKGEFGIDSIEEEFDRLIMNEKNHNKKFELLKLKNISLSQIRPALPPEGEKPIELAKFMKEKLTNFNL